MLTPQEVSEHVFAKVALGGYNMTMVDEFLDELTDDYTALFKENTALKAKMKVLVDKLEEYRETEDSMRAALLTAQKMASTMVADAEAKKDTLLAEAESAAKDKISELDEQIEAEQQKLNAAKNATADFIARTRSVCEQQMHLLEMLPDLTPEQLDVAPKAAAALAEKDVSAIGERILAAFQKESESEEPEESKEPTLVLDKEEELEPDDSPFVETATRPIKLPELKFGRNYKVDE